MKKATSWFKFKPQARTQFDEEELRLLGESLKVRQLHPVVCSPEGTVIAGERQVRAAILVGMTELEVKIIDDPITEAECKLLQFTENMHRQDLTAYEQWQGCVEMLHLNPGWMQKDLAREVKLCPSMVTRLLSPSDCTENVQTALAEGRIGISDCYAMSRLEPAEQEGALAMRLNGASRDELARHARRGKSADKPKVRVKRVKCDLGGGVSVIVSGNGLGLDEIIDALGNTQKEARKARDQHLDAKTWSAVMRDRARKGVR